MKKLNLRSRMTNEFVEIPVDFIDTYMPQASNEALKVYLYLLRSALDSSILLSVNDIADLFDVTPNKILQALSYWESQKLLSLEYKDGELTDITLLPIKAASTPALKEEKATEIQPEVSQKQAESVPANVTTLPVRNDAPIDLSVLNDDRQFDELLGLAEYYFKRPLSATQRDSLGFCYLLYDRQIDIIEFLLEYCLEQGKSSFHYIEAVARGWKEEGLRTLCEIKTAAFQRNRSVYAVMNAFGLKNRAPAKNEADFIARWTNDFDLPLVLEAVNRTMTAIHTPSFSYADSILASWKDAGVKTADDIAALDEKRRNTPKKDDNTPARKSANSFQNFDQRKTDYDSLIANYYES